MDAAAFHSHSVLRFSMCFSFSKLCYLERSCLSMKEVAVRPSPIVFQRVVSPLTVSSIRSVGHNVGQTSGRNENKKRKSFNGKKSKSSDQEEIIALFRRIKSSIAKGGDSQNTNKRSSKADKDKKPSTESILDILGEPQKQVKAGKISNRANEKDSTRRRGVHRKEHEVQEYTHILDFQLTRAPSNFVKKSPIPSLSTPRGKVTELIDEALPTIVREKQVHSEKVEELKLAELKQLAKSRGLKGYSKMKKDELIKLLRS